ncbi:MAG: right-handed parallel beta-helix repeat-containing protein [Uliginosibacterium sp.]|nr:right-handed parallel beta-helix repeat-containing protein [Uliginosibacterium sp.]
MKILLLALFGIASLISTAASASVMPIPSTLLASGFESKASTTTTAGGSQLLASNVTISNRFSFQSGRTYQFTVIARGTPAGGVYPSLRVGLDGYKLTDFVINSSTQKAFTFKRTIKLGGDRNLQLSFLNDASTATENRDLYIQSVDVRLEGTTEPSVPTVYPPSEGSDSPYPLEILQPQANLDARNRFYKAYPGLLYNVRLAVAGGSYPYRFALKTAPSGMSINASTGEINWPSPVASTKAYPTTVEVVDNRGIAKQVSWSILVTIDKFLFVDPVYGKVGASGTINDPVKGFYDVYGGNIYASKNSAVKQDYFVYFKGGATYTLDGFTNGEQGVQWTNRQPLVWLAYPGHRPVIEMSKRALRLVDTDANNFYFDGFEVSTVNTDAGKEFRMAIRIGSLSNNVTIRKSVFHGISATEGHSNQSAIMISADASGKYWSIQDNEFYDIHKAYGILGYTSQKVLVEDNYFHDNTGGHQIGPKDGTQYWTIRHNRMTNIANYKDGTYATGIWVYGDNTRGAPYGHMDVAYNHVSMVSGRALAVGESWNEKLGPVDVYRNTLVGEVNYTRMAPTMGRIMNQKNVMVNAFTSGYECSSCLTPNTLVFDGNITGGVSAGVVDANGKLTSRYSTYLGKVGWQFSNQ